MCDKEFIGNSDINFIHLHLNKISDCVVCQYCHCMLLIDVEQILSHCRSCRNISRPDVTYNYICIICSYHTLQSSHMRYHIRKHTGDKPFKCPHCSHKTGRKESLTMHIKLRHSHIE